MDSLPENLRQKSRESEENSAPWLEEIRYFGHTKKRVDQSEQRFSSTPI